ncbi:MAG: diacylglycerol kinase [Gammaproteobacteria bacterium]|nr:diacylglycerol kinase [Gammaproteobacteria bacterium]
MAKPGKTGFSRLVDATRYSWLGYKAGFKNEAAFRQELFLGVLLLPTAIIFAESSIELALLLGSLFLVLIVELLNSGIEAVVDRISDEHHELSGRAKDLGAAAVMTALINVIVIWSIIFIPKL